MTDDRIQWAELPAPLRDAVGQRLGGPYAVTDAQDASSCGIATLLTGHASRAVFVKGQRDPNPAGIPGERGTGDSWWGRDWTLVDELAMEQAVSPCLPPSAPRVLWSLRAFGWYLLAFEGLQGPLAEYAPGSPDLPLVAATLAELASWPTPALDLPTAWDRWGYWCSTGDRDLFDGNRLLHTDPASVNVVVSGGRARLVDWAWASMGPAWADACLWGHRLAAAGHTPGQAWKWADRVPAFAGADPRALAVTTRAEARRWQDLADERTPGAGHVAQAARVWADFVEHRFAGAR